MPCDFDQDLERRQTNSVKWDGVERVFGRADLLPMWVADMDFAAPPAVLAALRARIDHGVFGYTESAEAALTALAGWLARRHAWRIDPAWGLITPGVVSGLVLAVLALTDPVDEIVIQPPVYPPFYSVVENNGRRLVENPLRLEGGRYVMDLEGLARQLQDRKIKMLILCSPHNPVGRVWERGELEILGRLCLEHEVILVSDEIHADLIYTGYRHLPTAAISEDLAGITVTLAAPSKTFNLPGLTTAAAIIPNGELRAKYAGLRRRLHYGGESVMGLVGMEAAYEYGAEWLDELLSYLEANRDLLLDFLRAEAPGIEAVRPEGTYLAWLDCRGLDLEGGRLWRFLIDQAGLGLNDGRDFGGPGEGHARLNFGCPRRVLQAGLERLAEAVRKQSSPA